MREFTYVVPSRVVVPILVRLDGRRDHVEDPVVVADGRRPDATGELGARTDAALAVVQLRRACDHVAYAQNGQLMHALRSKGDRTNLSPILQVCAGVYGHTGKVKEGRRHEVERAVNAYARFTAD
jgi:hypothetical protein